MTRHIYLSISGTKGDSRLCLKRPRSSYILDLRGSSKKRDTVTSDLGEEGPYRKGGIGVDT